MDEFILEKSLTDESDSQTWIKEKLTSWADSIPYHDFHNFGKKASIESITLKPAYFAQLHTQYEERTVSAGKQPFKGQEVPHRKYYSISDVNPWESGLKSYDDFVEDEETYSVAGSQHVEPCDDCGGHGHITCPKCAGKKEITCPTCSGAKKVNCPNCHGRGNTSGRCSSCDGGGQVKAGFNESEQRWNYLPCSSCGGSGHKNITCSRCHGSKKIYCEKCKGSGRVTCSECKGTGTVPCRTCDSEGKLIHFFKIQQTLDHEYHKQTFHHHSIKKSFPLFEFLTNNSGDEQKIELEGTQIAFEQGEKVSAHITESNPELTANLQGLLDEASEPVSGSLHIIRQSLYVEQSDVFEVTYTMNNKNYILLIYGEENNVFATVSPITEVRDKYYKEALKAFENKKFSNSHQAIEKAAAMMDGLIIDDIVNLQEKLMIKVGQNYRIGTIIGAISGIVLLWNFTVDFLSTPRFFLPYLNDLFLETEWMQGMHEYVILGVLIFLNLNYVTMDTKHTGLTKYYGARVNSGIMRLLLSFVLTVLKTGMMWLSIIALNYAGIMLVITYPSHWVYLVYRFIVGLFS